MVKGAISITQDMIISRSGREYIPLRLQDYRKNRIQGAIILRATPYIDLNGMQAFKFWEEGGNLQFVYDAMQNGMFLKMLDCEHNRKFLASHYGYKFWTILDPAIDKEIQAMSKNISKLAVKIQTDEPVKEEEILSDDALEMKLAKLQAEAAKRKLRNVELKDKRIRTVVPETVPAEVTEESKPEEPASEVGLNEDTPSSPEEIRPIRRRQRKTSSLVTIAGEEGSDVPV